MDKQRFNDELLQFLQRSPSPFHAVSTMVTALCENGFQQLREEDSWRLQPGQGYFVTRNDSSIIAFVTDAADPAETGIMMAGAHTDSPCLKVKPNAVMHNASVLQFAVEIYGGVLLAPWFDRDLSLAGRVEFTRRDGSLESAMLDWRRPIATVPSLAIHLDREANQNRTINPQKEMPPVLALSAGDGKSVRDFDFNAFLQDALAAQHGIDDVSSVLAHELFFYDTQPPAQIGLHGEFIASARLDNLLSCYVCLDAIIQARQAEHGGFSLMVCNDHEEVGSASACGAQGPFLRSVLARLSDQFSAGGEGAVAENLERMIRRSLFLSIDNAHGLHPNYMDKHDGNHGPVLNQGPVVKINANQRYATNSRSHARFAQICEAVGTPLQRFVVRSDMGCGSTIGPITASGIGVETIDIGVPTYGMHSIRELAGSDDGWHLARAVRRLYQRGGRNV